MLKNQVHSGTPTTLADKSSIFLWNTLAFQAGAINAGGFLACHRFVTHVTGFSTMFGSEMATGNFQQAFGLLSVPLFFLAGSMTSALFVDRRIQRGQTPRYQDSFFALTLITGIVCFMGTQGRYGEFGAPLELGRDYSLLALLCLASGIQNATVSSAYGAVVRTTHLTGLTTDLGIGLVRLFSFGLKTSQARDELKASFMRVGILGSFTLGSVVASLTFYRAAYWGFLIPFGISLGLWLLSLAFRHKNQ